MERVVNFPCQGQGELIRHWGDLLDDFEGTVSFGRKLGGLIQETEIFPF